VDRAIRRCRYLGGLGEVDGFILKSRSPSCGIKDTKIYSGEGGTQPSDSSDTGQDSDPKSGPQSEGQPSPRSEPIDGETNPGDADAAFKQLGKNVDLIIDGGMVSGTPSTIINMVMEPPVIIRKGPITDEMIRKRIGKINGG